ncbi:MAG: hypothetical protein F6K24_46370 [Okeania sp. SIO2D1]|nr:hypothetical protein [Okeania sp. SIO2D1]
MDSLLKQKTNNFVSPNERSLKVIPTCGKYYELFLLTTRNNLNIGSKNLSNWYNK